MLVDTLALGVPLDAFWKLTYSEVRLHHEAAQKRMREQHEASMFATLQLAHLGRMARLPHISELVPWMEPRAQTLDDSDLTEQEQAARAAAREKADHAYLMALLAGRKGRVIQGEFTSLEAANGSG